MWKPHATESETLFGRSSGLRALHPRSVVLAARCLSTCLPFRSAQHRVNADAQDEHSLARRGKVVYGDYPPAKLN